MADNAAATSSFSWGDLLNLIGVGASLYGAGKGSGSTPNFYTLPTTPQEQTASDAKVNLYNYAGSYVDQFLRGLGDMNPTWAPSTPLLGPGGSGGFMGGVHVPVIDWSKMPSAPHVNPTGGTGDQKPGLPGAGTNAGNPDQHIPGPANPGQDPFADWPGNPNAKNYTWDDVKGMWGDNGVKIGMGILTQNPGMTIQAIIGILTNLARGNNGKLPDSNLDWSKIDFTPGNTPPGSTPPPAVGTNTGDYPLGINKPRDVTVGGNLGDPGKAPPGWSLDNPYGWLDSVNGGGNAGGFDPMNGSPWGRKPRF